MSDGSGIRHAVILSGGGAYGSFEVGVLRSLLGERAGRGMPHGKIRPSIYTGTSVGAINAAVMVSQNGLGVPDEEAAEYLEYVWLNLIADSPQTCGNGAYRVRADPIRFLLNPQCLADPGRALAELTTDSASLAESFLLRTMNFFNSPDPLQTRVLEFVDLSAWISPEPLYRLVREIISLEGIRRSQIELRVVAANWETGEVAVFKNEDMTDDVGYQIILGSAAIPGFFPPQYIGGYPFVDGGVVMNTPLKTAIQAGGDVLHIIYLDPDIANLPLKVLQNTYNTLDRTILINNATVINEDIETAGWINRGLDVVERAARGESISDENVRDFLRVAAQIEQRLRQGAPYRRLTLHRYHPEEDPGGGGVGVLNFNRDRMARFIEQGFAEADEHDCDENGCRLPEARPGRASEAVS
jgi:predicted acylesterase/phospholipase RssA